MTAATRDRVEELVRAAPRITAEQISACARIIITARQGR